MLRVLVLALVLANAVYLVWAQGLLTVYGFGPASQAEPERLAQQIRPEAMQLLAVSPARPPGQMPLPTHAQPPATVSSAADDEVAPAASSASPTSAASAPAAAPVTAQCLQAGPFTDRQASAMRPRLEAGLPAGSWTFQNTGEPIRWILYMGKYISKEAMDRKRVKLEQQGVRFEAPVSPLLNPGLSLGSFATKAEAETALANLNERGVRSAKVVLERPELPNQLLRLPAVDAALQPKAQALIPQVAGKPLQACA